MLTESHRPFQVVPAVDVLGEEAVRLQRGDLGHVTLRERDPRALVGRYAGAGASLVHLVDLTAAAAGEIRPDLVRRMVEAANGVPVQVGGGIRSLADAERLLGAGAARVVVGTAAFAGPDALQRYAGALGEALVVALDARGGAVAVDAWRRTTAERAEDAATRCRDAGVARLLCTAIERDGTMTGPDVGLLERVCVRSGLPVLASGGVRSFADLEAVEAAGCDGAVVGRALLEGALPLTSLGARGHSGSA